MYLDKNDVIYAINEMQNFERDLNHSFNKRGYSFRTNLGRRNALLSMSQEIELANALRRKYKDVIDDGAPGKPDIVIKDINVELECKLTSGSSATGTFNFQTDWDTLSKKEKLDYCYILCDTDFENFCVLHFKGLTIDDFREPAPGSRGKSAMKKYKGMEKVDCLYGSYTVINENRISSLNEKVAATKRKAFSRFKELRERLLLCGDSAPARRKKTLKTIRFEKTRYQKRIKKLSSQIDYWKMQPNKYSFNLEPIVNYTVDDRNNTDAAL